MHARNCKLLVKLLTFILLGTSFETPAQARLVNFDHPKRIAGTYFVALKRDNSANEGAVADLPPALLRQANENLRSIAAEFDAKHVGHVEYVSDIVLNLFIMTGLSDGEARQLASDPRVAYGVPRI